jgi:ATP-binding cassette subfamily C protein LapB
VRPSAGTVDDPLLDRQISNEALIAGLPMAEDAMLQDLFVRAASRASISARLVHRPLAALDTMALPCVLLLQGKR